MKKIWWTCNDALKNKNPRDILHRDAEMFFRSREEAATRDCVESKRHKLVKIRIEVMK